MTKRTALVTGATGLVGSYLLKHLLDQGGWDIVAVSRGKPAVPGDYRHIAVDLLDRADCERRLASLTNVTHIFYVAYANQAFNITNGDLIRWQNLWPRFADFFDMGLAPPRHIGLSRAMTDKGPIWDRIVAEHGLQRHRFEDIAAWGYPENVFNSDYDIVSDTSKARRLGFHDLVDTEEMFFRMFADFREKRLIP
jgi:NAD(P)-dependent dehydrogenase (short-subunit alcohol dehydrogenase family)